MTLEPALGVDIERVCLEMQQVSRTLGVEVRCKANDVMLYARPRGDHKLLIEGFHREAAIQGKPFRAAHSWRE